MPEARFRGPYIRKNVAFLKEKANLKHDPRHRFYEAMLMCDTYEAYYREAGEVKVEPATYKTKPVTAHMEIRYARLRGWIGTGKNTLPPRKDYLSQIALGHSSRRKQQ
jgi:hypothetical protein